MSATPSSSISRSSTQLFFVRALHLRSQAAYLRVKGIMRVYLIVGVLVKHLSADVDALLVSLPIKPADC
jgi:hypothetical protein